MTDDANLWPLIDRVQIKTKDDIMKPRGEVPVVERFGKNVADIVPGDLSERFEGEDKLIYDMSIRGVTMNGAVKRGKAFVRANNLFEPAFITTIQKFEETDGSPMNIYRVVLGIQE